MSYGLATAAASGYALHCLRRSGADVAAAAFPPLGGSFAGSLSSTRATNMIPDDQHSSRAIGSLLYAATVFLIGATWLSPKARVMLHGLILSRAASRRLKSSLKRVDALLCDYRQLVHSRTA